MIDNLLTYENEDDHHLLRQQYLTPNTSVRLIFRNYIQRETTRQVSKSPEAQPLLSLLIHSKMLADYKIQKHLLIGY